MTLGFGIKVFLEIGAVLLLVVGYMNEEKVIKFEEELFSIIKFVAHKQAKTKEKHVEKSNEKYGEMSFEAAEARANSAAKARAAAAAMKKGTALETQTAQIKAFPNADDTKISVA